MLELRPAANIQPSTYAKGTLMAESKLTCPICQNPLALIPVEVGPDSIRYEARCMARHTNQQMARALASLGRVVKP